MSTTFPMEGACDGGADRFRIETTPLIVHCCHRRWCQREAASAASKQPWVLLAKGTSAVSGYYDWKQYWRPDSQDRRRKIAAKKQAR